MRKSLLLLAVLGALGFALPAKAQTDKGEIYVGYVYNRTYINSGSFNTATGTSVPFTFNGGQIQGQYNLNDYLSAFGYFSGAVTPAQTIQLIPGSPRNSRSIAANYALNFGGGPRLYVSRGRIAPFFEVGLGAVHTGLAPSGNSATAFELAAGGGVDITLNNRISIRPGEIDYVVTKLPDNALNVQSGFTYSGGVIIRFGSK